MFSRMTVEAAQTVEFYGGEAGLKGGTRSCLVPCPPPAAFDHLLVYTQLPGSKSQLKVDYKAMKQHCYEGRVTPIHFFLI